MSTSSHSSSWMRHEQHHDVGADGEVAGVVGDDEGVEVVARAAGLQRLGDERTMSPPSEFILEWNSMQPTPSPRSMSEAPAFFFTTPFGFLGDGDRPDAGGNFFRLVVAGGDVEVLAAAGGLRCRRRTRWSCRRPAASRRWPRPGGLPSSCARRSWRRRRRPTARTGPSPS